MKYALVETISSKNGTSSDVLGVSDDKELLIDALRCEVELDRFGIIGECGVGLKVEDYFESSKNGSKHLEYMISEIPS